MAQAPTPDELRERAVSSEPCSTRPNPFDDTDTSRKRRRTSRSGASRSRSVDTVNSSQGSHMVGDSAPEPRSDSAMKIDTDPATPTTPEQQQAPSVHPASGPRSSRVTINVRTPSRPLEVIPSSPASPLPTARLSSANDSADAVHISVEESELDMSRDDTVADTPGSSSPEGSSSPPVEIVTVQPEDDADFDTDEPGVTILGGLPSQLQDPSPDIPFLESGETYGDCVNRLCQYITNHETVSRAMADWIDSYLIYVKGQPYSVLMESYQDHQEVWRSVPDFLMFMMSRKVNYPRNPQIRDGIFLFYRLFARLAAYFVELDVKSFRNAFAVDQSRLPVLASPCYLQALAALTSKAEVAYQSQQIPNGEDGWQFANELPFILDNFVAASATQSGPLAFIKQLVQIESDLAPRFPKLAEHLAHMSLLTSNVLLQSHRKLHNPSSHPQMVEQSRSNIARGYAVYKSASAALTMIIEKHINCLSFDSASNLLSSLTDIYQYSLAADRIVPGDVTKVLRQNNPSIALRNIPEAVAYHWKFSKYAKLIMSSQMQLRVMAVTAMCSDLVTFYRKFNEGSDESNAAFLNFVAEFLLQTGLVSYILGPTCHPEITLESGNIIGFLVVSRTYKNEHTDALWQTVTSAQDPRVSDALIRMASRITNLFHYEELIYLCGKLDTVPVDSFSPTMREFCDQIFRQLCAKSMLERQIADSAPYDLCIRLIRQASTFGQQTPIAYHDVQQWAIQKLKELLLHGPTPECRRQIYLDCVEDIARKSTLTIGSLWVITLMVRTYVARELHTLAAEHNLTRLAIEELEAAIPVAQQAGFPAVLSGPQNYPRKEIIGLIICNEPATLDRDLGSKLWHLLVGAGAASKEDRDVAWQILNNACKRARGENPFTSTCFSEYLPTLTPECFCLGVLEFVREGVLPLVNDQTSILLDDDESPDRAVIEQLWRIILAAPESTIEQQAIQTLVNDVYIESRSIMSFSHYRARKVHLGLVDRCLRQLCAAAARLKSFGVGMANGDEDSMDIVATDQQLHEQELLFIRSLSVLREFHQLYQAKGQFSAPDLRSLILSSPSNVDGESAELKYQSFDGSSQTEVKPLLIGKRNTAASLLASLREATGFNNYRIYYRGRPFVPQESDICKSLEDLHIQNGIILVKKELDVPASPTRPRAGASPVEVEILGHFEELWEYLSMEEKLAQEIYSFLVKLPADENVLKAIEDPSTSYMELFPAGQPFKSLYAVHALQEYLMSQRRKFTPAQFDKFLDNQQTVSSPYVNSLIRAMALVVSAISDRDVLGQCSSQKWRIELSSSLVGCFLVILKDPFIPASATRFLDASLLDRLLAIMSAACSSNASTSAIKIIPLCLQSILESCSWSKAFMTAFVAHANVPRVLEDLLLYDPRMEVRQNTMRTILEKVDGSALPANDTTSEFQEFFWPLVSDLVAPAIANAGKSTEVLQLCFLLFRILRNAHSQVLDMQKHIDDWCDLLLGYTSYEDMTQPEIVDVPAASLIRLLHSILCGRDAQARQEIHLPRGVARKIFWKHLFPHPEKRSEAEHRPILSQQSRAMLMEIIFSLVEDDPTQLMWLLEDLNDLVPISQEDDGGDMYLYELLQQFERAKAIRSPCGYVGLRNLSNTCYLNSLFTQLFMNVDFRRFMINAEVGEKDFTQALLFHTQRLFGLMQGSVRRCITPEDCVANIKTPDDSQIDIHNQMDVDEFYNLLFDRWESQLSNNEEKRQFRSFYGGQLVQQVASKECEHISERLEPFSAIQCDIKGKSSLQESLQAYVDGEIMEGENKYKCSTCDRHVDAVKRACLKDIPDNLIFTLKRFDFNIRLMQRSKINDYFSFPTTIDMRPYTIEHLTNPSDESKPEDIFELVGVLVHSGTAESGHYYSFIRERPSSSENPVWVEFNDDTVSSWDPAGMENACFGGPDFRPHFESSSPLYDRTYSAYMLFYQRSTSLAKGQESLRESGSTSPLRVQLPPRMTQAIAEENLLLLWRHCLYDPSQIQFVTETMARVRNLNDGTCSRDHRMEDVAMTMALSHLDQVASRTKDVPDFFPLLGPIGNWCRGCVRCCMGVYQYSAQYPESLRFMVQRNQDSEVRQALVALFIEVLENIKERLPVQYGLPPTDSDEDSDEDDFENQTSVITGVVDLFKPFFENFHLTLRSWPEVFDFMLSFVKMGRHEKAGFLERTYLRSLLYIISADLNLDLPPQFARMIGTVSRRLASRPPSYEAIISLIDVLTTNMLLTYDDRGESTGAESPDRRQLRPIGLEDRYLFTKHEARLVHQEWGRGQGNIFVDKLIAINQNTDATHSIIWHLVEQSPVMEERVHRTLKTGINTQVPKHQNAPYLSVASQVFCRVAKQPELIANLIAHVSQQCATISLSLESKEFLDFQRAVFDGPQENSGGRPEDILMAGYDNLVDWVPGLLNCAEPSVVNETEEFLHEVLFKYGPSPFLGDTEEGRRQGSKIFETARLLGIRCLLHLHDNYVAREADVSARLIAGLERVIKECSQFFDLKEPGQDELSMEFIRLNNSVMDPLRRLAVDEVDEDGSGMFFSDSSSIASSNTAG